MSHCSTVGCNHSKRQYALGAGILPQARSRCCSGGFIFWNFIFWESDGDLGSGIRGDLVWLRTIKWPELRDHPALM